MNPCESKNRLITLFFDDSGHLKKSLAAVLLLPVTLLILIQAYSGKFDWSPDEYDHYAAAKVFAEHWVPPPVGDDAILFAYSRYGYSYFDNYEVCYFLAGKMLLVGDVLGIPPFFTIRSFNAFLWLGIAGIVLGVARLRVLSLFLILSPQVWYLFTYFNADAASLFQAIMLIALLTGPAFGRGKNQILFWPAILLLTFSKSNFLVFVGFSLFVAAYLICREKMKGLKLMLVALLGSGVVFLTLLGLRMGADHLITGPNKMEQRLAVVEQLAAPAYLPENAGKPGANPNMRLREQGVSIKTILFEYGWVSGILRDAAGLFGFNQKKYYIDPPNKILMFLLPMLLMTWLLAAWLDSQGDTQLILLIACACLLANIAAALMFTWLVDYQPRFRYLTPGVLCLTVPILMFSGQKFRYISVAPALFAYALAMVSFVICVLLSMPRSETFSVGRDPLYFHRENGLFLESQDDFYKKRKTMPAGYP